MRIPIECAARRARFSAARFCQRCRRRRRVQQAAELFGCDSPCTSPVRICTWVFSPLNAVTRRRHLMMSISAVQSEHLKSGSTRIRLSVDYFTEFLSSLPLIFLVFRCGRRRKQSRDGQPLHVSICVFLDTLTRRTKLNIFLYISSSNGLAKCDQRKRYERTSDLLQTFNRVKNLNGLKIIREYSRSACRSDASGLPYMEMTEALNVAQSRKMFGGY